LCDVCKIALLSRFRRLPHQFAMPATMEREHGHSPLREAGKAQAGDEEFEDFWCRKRSVLAIAGDGQLGVDGEHSAKFGARLVEPADRLSCGGTDRRYGAGGEDGNFVAALTDGVPRCPSQTT